MGFQSPGGIIPHTGMQAERMVHHTPKQRLQSATKGGLNDPLNFNLNVEIIDLSVSVTIW